MIKTFWNILNRDEKLAEDICEKILFEKIPEAEKPEAEDRDDDDETTITSQRGLKLATE